MSQHESPRMEKTSTEFERELEVFRKAIAKPTQFFNAYLAVHNVASENKSVYRLLNKAPLFWNTILGALQLAAFITLGSIFDRHSKHNVDRLLRIALENACLFSKEALASRLMDRISLTAEQLNEHLSRAYVPTSEDFRSFRKNVKKWRDIYEGYYRDVRDKFFVHIELSDQSEIDALFAKTKVGELKSMFAFLDSLYKGLWHLYFNGLRPDLIYVESDLQKRIADEAEGFLVASCSSQPEEK